MEIIIFVVMFVVAVSAGPKKEDPNTIRSKNEKITTKKVHYYESK